MPYARLVRRAACLLSAGVLSTPLMAETIATASGSRASRRCAFQHAAAGRGRLPELRAAVACLVNRARARWGLAPLRWQGRLQLAAQGHSNQMVRSDYFSHRAPGGIGPGTRLDRVGYRWWALGETIATGYRTPAQTVRAWLASPDHCRILLSPLYRQIGVGINPRPVRRVANGAGTWTLDAALPAGRHPPPGSWRAADGCPH
jgi:uncharacterized protein YkwD